jgi:hypothetical protein
MRRCVVSFGPGLKCWVLGFPLALGARAGTKLNTFVYNTIATWYNEDVTAGLPLAPPAPPSSPSIVSSAESFFKAHPLVVIIPAVVIGVVLLVGAVLACTWGRRQTKAHGGAAAGERARLSGACLSISRPSCTWGTRGLKAPGGTAAGERVRLSVACLLSLADLCCLSVCCLSAVPGCPLCVCVPATCLLSLAVTCLPACLPACLVLFDFQLSVCICLSARLSFLPHARLPCTPQSQSVCV